MSSQADEWFFSKTAELEGRNEEAEEFLSEDENPVKNCPKNWVTFGDFLLASARKAAKDARPPEEPPKVQPSDFGEPELNFSATQPPRAMDLPRELPKLEVPESFPKRPPAVPELPEGLEELETEPEVERTSGQKPEENVLQENVVRELEKKIRAISEKEQQQVKVLQANCDILQKNLEAAIYDESAGFQFLVEEKAAPATQPNSARDSGEKSRILVNLGKEHGVFVRQTGEAGPVTIQLAKDPSPLFTGSLGLGVHLSIDSSNFLRLKAPLPNEDHRTEKRPIGFSKCCIVAILADDISQIHLEKS